MQTSMLKGAPVLCKFRFLANRMRQLFKFGKAKQAHKACQSNSSNNNCETENNNNNNSELCKFSQLFTNEMAQNAANEWLLQQTAATSAVITYEEDMEAHVICLQTEAGHFYWNAANGQRNKID